MRPSGSQSPTVVVLAKAPVPGRAKTRLTPPCDPIAAAAIAEAALLDTLEAVEAWGGRRLLALDRCDTTYRVDGWPTIGQRDGSLGDRLDGVFRDVFLHTSGPVFLVAMDTPQLRAVDLEAALAPLLDTVPTGSGAEEAADAVLGPATDGGYWGIGFRSFTPTAFDHVPMSTDRTGRAQLDRLRALGRRVAVLHELDDMDTFDDVLRIAERHPLTRVGRVVASPNWWRDAVPVGAV